MKRNIGLFIALVTLVFGPALAAGQNPSPGQRFDYLVRADFFAGVAGDETRLTKAIDRCERALEVNPKHPVVLRLKTEEKKFDDWAAVLFDQALLAEGGQLDDPAAFVKRINALMLEMGGGESRIIVPGA